MPTYSYTCKDCDHAFDISQAFTDDALTVCPECSGKLRKVWGSVGVVFKGSGFYRNDSRDADAKKSSKADPAVSSTSADSKSSDTTSSESKPESAPSKDSSSTSTGSATKSDSKSSAAAKSPASASSGAKSVPAS
ncbi:MAG: FmdB family zinc ribbon protein [Allobranchiibius sp.]